MKSHACLGRQRVARWSKNVQTQNCMDNRVRTFYHYIIILSPVVALCLSVQCSWQAHVFEHWAQLVVLWESWSLASRTTRGGPYLHYSLLPCEGHLQACTMAGNWAVSSASRLRTETPWNYKLLSPVIGYLLTVHKKNNNASGQVLA